MKKGYTEQGTDRPKLPKPGGRVKKMAKKARYATRVCPDPHCSEIAHFSEERTKCANCGLPMRRIIYQSTFERYNWLAFQFDYRTGDVCRLKHLPDYDDSSLCPNQEAA